MSDVEATIEYGSDFWQNHLSAKNYRPEELVHHADILPFTEELAPILVDAVSIKFVEFAKGSKWRYVVQTMEKRPDGKGMYECEKIYNRTEEGWNQEKIIISPGEEPLTVIDRVQGAISSSMHEALVASLGSVSADMVSSSPIINRSLAKNLPHGQDIINFISPEGTVRYIDSIALPDRSSNFPTLTEAAVSLKGESFAVALSNPQNTQGFSFLDDRYQVVFSHFPQIDKLQKAKKWYPEDRLKLVRWSERGHSQYAYVNHSLHEKGGISWNFLEVFSPVADSHGQATLKTDIAFLRSERPVATTSCYVIENHRHGIRSLQILRPIADHPGDYENIFIGISALNGRTIDVTAVYPHIAHISTSDKNKHRGQGAMSYATYPVCYIPRLEVAADKKTFRRYLDKKSTDVAVFGHEYGHFEQNINDLNTSLEASRRGLKIFSSPFPVFFTQASVILWAETLANLPDGLRGELLPWVTGGGIILGNTLIEGDLWLRLEENAEINAKLFIQACRSFGVDLFNGVPDSQLSLFINENWWPPVRNSISAMLQPRLRFK